MFIYRFTNKNNGKMYIGQSIRSIKDRLKSYKSEAKNRPNRPVLKAMNKYGFENFSFEIIDTAANIDELNDKEQYYIEYFNTLLPMGYNADTGGKNKKASQETREKMSARLKGKPLPLDMHEKARKANLGRIPSEETRLKISKSNEGKRNSVETRRKISESNKGRKPPVIKEIICVDTGITYESITKAADILKLQISKISAVCRGKRKRTGGLTFKFTENNNKEQSLNK